METSFEEYQKAAKTTAIYPRSESGGHSPDLKPDCFYAHDGIIYTALGLANEAGEVLGKLKKVMRDNKGILTPEKQKELEGELGDVMWYISNMASELHLDLGVIARNNIIKLIDRQKRGVLGGSGDTR